MTHEMTLTKAEHVCSCGHDAEIPALDARVIPHAVRHAAIFGALDSLPVGGALDLTAPHNPLPLLAQLEERQPATWQIAYLVEGPEAWTLRLTRSK